MGRPGKLRIRLSTLLLLALVVSVLLGWFVDRADRNRRELIGTWKTGDPVDIFYLFGEGADTLQINADGTFTYTDDNRWGRPRIYEGTYTCQENGEVAFHVKRCTWGDSPPQSLEINIVQNCRCAIDSTQCLIVKEVSKSFFSDSQREEPGIDWRVYARSVP